MTVGLDINEKEGKKTQKMARDMGGQMIFIQTDLCKDEEIAQAVADAAKLGTIKFVANIAGLQHIDSIDNFPMEKYDLMQRLMLRAPFLLSKLTIPHMRKSKDGVGVIGHMASIHAHICTKNKPVYNITKFGLRALAQSISAEGRGSYPFLHHQHRFHQDPAGSQPDPGPGRPARHYPGGGGAGCHAGQVAHQGNDGPDRGGQSLPFRLLAPRPLSHRRGPALRRRRGIDILMDKIVQKGTMSETAQIIIGILLLVGVYILTQVVVGYRIKRTARGMVRDLDFKKAYSAESAIELPYAKSNLFRIGLRDFRPKSVAALVQARVIAQTAAGRYFLTKRPQELNFSTPGAAE